MSLAGLSTLAVLTSILTTATAQTTTDDDCPSRPNVAAIVVGTIAATLAVVAVILAIGLLWWRRQQKGKTRSMAVTPIRSHAIVMESERKYSISKLHIIILQSIAIRVPQMLTKSQMLHK